MEQIELLLALIRGICIAYFLTQGVIFLIEGRKSRIKLSMGGVMILYADQFVLNVVSNYFSDSPADFSKMLSLFEMFAVPATAMFIYELIQLRGLKTPQIIYNLVPFAICFLAYSVTHNDVFFMATTALAVIYGLLALTYFQSLLIRRLRLHKSYHPEERPYYVRLNIIIWLLLVVMCVWSILIYNGNPFSLIIYNLFTLAVWVILSYLAHKGTLKFVNQLGPDLDDVDEDDLESLEEQIAKLRAYRASSVAAESEAEEAPEDDDEDEDDEEPEEIEEPAESEDEKIYRDTKSDEKTKELIFYMEVQKAYLDPALSVNDVASHLSINRTYTSLIINKRLNTTFSAYVNKLRVNHAKQLLVSTDKPIEDVYKASGFKSRSTFWRAFCQQENCNPRDYRNEHSPV